MNALAIAYPVNAYVDIDPKMPHRNAFCLSNIEKYYSKYTAFKKGEVKKDLN